MVILCDSREQTPLKFNHQYITGVKVMKLNVGDYQCQFTDGHIPPISFERKSLNDLAGSLSKGYRRFKKEILRAKENNIQLIIIIEGSLSRIIKGIPQCERCGDDILQQLNTIMERYNIPYVPLNNREELSRYITERFLAIGRERINSKKEKS